ncbi:hypothetical protein [Nesterenkonia suensis]
MSRAIEGISTTAYVCIHGVGSPDSGDLADRTYDAVRRGAEAAGGTLTELPVEAAAPAALTHRARIEVPGHEPYLAEFHDGWWSSGLRAPQFWVVLLWVLEVAPFALISGVGGWYGDRWREAPDGVGPLRRAAGRVAALLTTAAMLAAVPLICLVLLVGLPLAGLVPPWRRRLRHPLVEIVGDAWLYRSAVLDDTVLPQLTRLVEAASARADRVALVGHSQGAELSRRVALRTTAARCVWVGSGEHHLNTVRMAAVSGWLPLMAWPFVLGWPIVLHLALTRGGGLLPHSAAGTVTGAVTGAGVLLLAALLYGGLTAGVIRWLRRRPADVGQVPESRIWHVKSLLDPVSWGTVFPSRLEAQDRQPGCSTGSAAEHDDGGPGPVCVRYVPAHRRQPWWAEHVTYFSRPATGAVILEAGLAQPAPVLPPAQVVVPWWIVALSPAVLLGLLGVTAVLGRWQSGPLP